jgi:hypothetical protein
MKFQPSGKKAVKDGVNPFGAMLTGNTQPAGPGTGVPRARPGIGKPEAVGKRVRPFAQALGDTPERDGPFAASAKQVAIAMPPKGRVHQSRRKTAGLDPSRNNGGGR